MKIKKPVYSAETLRIANVGYLNSVPYRVTRDLPWAIYSEESPSTCARMLHEDEADLGLIPIAELIQRGGYTALDYGIASKGPVKSVLLVADCPLDQLERVAVDGSSHASASLLRLMFHELGIRNPAKLPFHRYPPTEAAGAVGGTTGALVIGDSAFGVRDKFAVEIDLASWWKELTGLPFLFAVWAGKSERISARSKELIESFEFGISQREVFAREWAEQRGWDKDGAASYVTENILYKITDEIRAGAEEFVRRASAAGIFPPTPIEWHSAPQRRTPRTVDAILSAASEGSRISVEEALRLAAEASLADLSLAADARRAQLLQSPAVSYIVDRNINYTNVCNVFCRFCAFYRAPGKRGGYLLTKEEIGQKIEEMMAAGGIQILLQGGLNPELGIEFYEELFTWLKERYPINLHALSADEILHICEVSHLTIPETIQRLIDVGLGSLPGGGAEILVDRVRQRVARLKSATAEWLEVHRVAHRLGITSTCTMMFGVQESWEDRILHMLKLRTLQDETAGFTAFITWPFQDDNTKLKRGDTSSPEYLRVQAIARLFFDNIRNVQSSWVTMGPSIGQVALSFGANDFGSVMFEENVVSSAGTTYCIDSGLIERHILEAGFVPWRRTVHFRPTV